jgi:hypothetical protein
MLTVARYLLLTNLLIGICAPLVAAPPGAPSKPPTTAEEVEQHRLNSLKNPAIPPLDAIETMTAEAYSHVLAPLVKDVPSFKVPKAEYSRLLNHFRECELDARPWPDEMEIGTIRIELVGGRMTRICWFWEGQKGRMVFTWAGIRYRTVGKKFAEDETLAFDTVVRKMAELSEK